jgi:hypothetical protein
MSVLEVFLEIFSGIITIMKMDGKNNKGITKKAITQWHVHMVNFYIVKCLSLLHL